MDEDGQVSLLPREEGESYITLLDADVATMDELVLLLGMSAYGVLHWIS